MFIRIVVLSFISLMIVAPSASEAKSKKKKLARKQTSGHVYKSTKHSRKSRHYRHHGTGPDLKSITTESPYKEDPSNGVTPIETKQPGI